MNHENYNIIKNNIDLSKNFTQNAKDFYDKGLWKSNTESGRKLIAKYFKDMKEVNSLPESLITYKEDYFLSDSCKSILVLSDIHLPYYSKESILTAIEFGLENEVDTIYLNGDIVDFHSVSRFETNPNERNLMQEIEISRAFFKYLRNVFSSQKIIWKFGNHEERWNSFLTTKASELFNLDVLKIEKLFKVEELDIETIDGRTFAHFGNLTVIHGHELPRGISSPVNPARGLYMKAKESALCGHHHQTSEHTEKSINGKIVSCWTTGCLSSLRPDYAPVNKYNHGFAHVTINNKDFEVRNYKIINNKIY
jgi:predicted phosphodiesterase